MDSSIFSSMPVIRLMIHKIYNYFRICPYISVGISPRKTAILFSVPVCEIFSISDIGKYLKKFKFI